MNVLIAMDSFKGSISSKEAGQTIAKAISKYKGVISRVVTVSDGGEGSLYALRDNGLGEFVSIKCVDAFGKPLCVDCLVIEKGEEKIGFVESASIIGLHDYKVNEKTVNETSSYGLGLVIKKLYKLVDQVIVFLGGTITTDGGLGLLQAFGVDLFDKDGNKLALDKNPLFTFDHLDLKQLNEQKTLFKDKTMIAASDVTNPYAGKKGASFVFAKQKGASQHQIEILDRQLYRVEHLLSNQQKFPSGSGAAGGIGGMLSVFDAEIVPGFDVLNRFIKIDNLIKNSDFVFTGEGSMDSQSNNGKLPQRIGRLANEYGVPVVALCGKREENLGNLEDIFSGIFSIQLCPVTLEQAMMTTKECLSITSNNIFRVFISRCKGK